MPESPCFNWVQPPPPAHLGAGEERRADAGPLPLKRGEIGFVDNTSPRLGNAEPFTPLPSRHPADREYPPSVTDPTHQEAPIQSANQLSLDSGKSRNLLCFLRGRKAGSVGGLQVTTLILFTCQLLTLGGTVAAWLFAAKLLKGRPATGQYLPGAGSTAVFAHILFVIVIIGQLIFLERRLFRLRAQRYSYLHPDEVIRHRNSPSTESAIAFAPWNRPPLPSYAAALAQSGVGTGDIEDNLIAVPPPPAYGNIRGSTLLLAGDVQSGLLPVHRSYSARSAQRMSRS